MKLELCFIFSEYICFQKNLSFSVHMFGPHDSINTFLNQLRLPSLYHRMIEINYMVSYIEI